MDKPTSGLGRKVDPFVIMSSWSTATEASGSVELRWRTVYGRVHRHCYNRSHNGTPWIWKTIKFEVMEPKSLLRTEG